MDFYTSINGEWMKNNPIPEDETRWSQFNILHEKNLKRLLGLVKLDPKMKLFFNQGMNHDNISLILNKLEEINGIKSINELLNYSFLKKIGASFPVELSVSSDFNDSSVNIIHLDSGGLGLPDRDYYFGDKVERYKQFISSYSSLFNLKLEGIFEFEKLLAEYTLTTTERRDPKIQNNVINNISELFPNIYRIYQDIIKSNKVNILNTKFMSLVNKLYDELSLEKWKDYYKWRLILALGNYTTVQVQQSLFDFYSKYLSGTKKMKPLWKRILSNVESKLGMMLGKLYVERYFSESSKKKVIEMVEFIKLILKKKIKSNWMLNQTKGKALIKLNKMKTKVGYPDEWRDYSDLVLSGKGYLENNIILMIYNYEYELKRIGQPVDKKRWFMSPQTINAYYSPTNNEIVFPAGILQSPFFDINSHIAKNFGGIGSIIGHEITHGFDDQGRKFDENGDLNDWWTEQDENEYKKIQDKVEELYGSQTVEGMKLNGKLTLGENIADIGGVSISLEALSEYLNLHPEENTKENGLSPYHLFFINYATIWRSNIRPEEAKKRVITDPHSPPKLRVNLVLSQMKMFYDVFKIKSENKYLVNIF